MFMRIFITTFIAVFMFTKGWTQEATTASDDSIYILVEQMPAFGTCADLLGEPERSTCSKNQLMLYVLRKLPLAEDIQVGDIKVSEVIVRFVIDENGTVQKTRLIKGVNSDFDKTFLEIFESMPTWQAGLQDGKAVKVEITLPMNIHF